MVEGPAPGRESVIAIDEQDRENVAADGLKTSHADKGNRRGNKSVFLGAFPKEINSLGRRFVSHQPPQMIAQTTALRGPLSLVEPVTRRHALHTEACNHGTDGQRQHHAAARASWLSPEMRRATLLISFHERQTWAST